MKDLTQGSIVNHIVSMAAPVCLSMLCSIAYHVIDLYYLSEVGFSAVAGVTAATTSSFFIVSVANVLGAGSLSLIAQALGRGDHEAANLILNQGLALSTICGVAMVALLITLISPYLHLISAEQSTVEAGIAFSMWMLPGYFALLPMAVLSSALRAAGSAWPAIGCYMFTVTMNALLAPILIAGRGTSIPLGPGGAGIATSISLLLGTILMAWYVHHREHHFKIRGKELLPQRQHCSRILFIGLPAGAEIALTILVPAVVLYVIRELGSASQAGYSIGLRISQAILVPGMSISFSVAPIVGQNLGAAQGSRVMEAFRKAVLIGSLIMICTTLTLWVGSTELVKIFREGSSASATAVTFLRFTSLTFVAQSLIYTSSGMFQGLGHTSPAMISSALCFVTFTALVLWLSTLSTFRIELVWYSMAAMVTLQAALNLWLLQRELKKRLRT